MCNVSLEIDGRAPNATTIKAIEESEEMILHPEKYKWHDDVDELFKDLLAE